MSYPDLGCFAECLTCELCGPGLPPNQELNLGLPPDYYDPSWADDGWFDPPDEDGPFDDLPPGIPLGDDLWITPTWDPLGFELHGRF